MVPLPEVEETLNAWKKKKKQKPKKKEEEEPEEPEGKNRSVFSSGYIYMVLMDNVYYLGISWKMEVI